MLGVNNLYWASFSGKEMSTPTLPEGIVGFCISVVPLAMVSFPTLYIYIRIIKVKLETIKL